MYFEPEIHRALRLKAATSDKSISDKVNDAVKLSLTEDAEDLRRTALPNNRLQRTALRTAAEPRR